MSVPPAGFPPPPLVPAAAGPSLPGGPNALPANPGGPEDVRLCQNGPVQNQMQFPSVYGSYPQNYGIPSGHYSEMPNKAIPSQLDNHYRADYYSAHYSVPAQNVITSSVTPNVASTQGLQHLYSRVPHTVESSGPIQGMVSSASQLHTSVPQSYSSFVSPYGSSASHSASSSVPSQGFVAPPGHYAMPSVSSAAYPNVSYPPVSIGTPYGQVPTSHSVPALGHAKEANAYSSQSRTTAAVQQKVPLGYNSAPWSAPELQSTEGSHGGSFAGSLSRSVNPISTGPPHPVNQSVQPTRPAQGTSSTVTSSERTPGVEKTTKPTVASSITQPPESLLHEGMNVRQSEEHDLMHK